MNTNKFLLPTILGLLLISSGIFNVIEYNKVEVFESKFGTYENLLQNTRQANQAKDKIDHTITVYMKAETPESQISALKNLLESQGLFQSIQYISADQALSDFKTRHKDDPLILQALDELGTNPLAAMITITISDSSQKQSLIGFIRAKDVNSITDKIN